jgi:ABC-type nitrate/sulfonate/bicarbonate transport system permease component
MPGIVTGLQLSLTVALLLCLTTEMMAAKSGLGYLIWNSWSTFSVEPMYSGLVVCALLRIGFQYLLDLIERLVLPWKPR